MLLFSGVAYAAVVRGTNGDDNRLNGTPRSDSIYGLAGDDGLRGYASGDTLDGGAGADHLRGMGGPDLLLGRGGRDVILGQSGSDSVNGGSGNDTIRVDQPKGERADRVECGKGYDTVYANRRDLVPRNCEDVTIG
jgi:serralysin